VDAAVLQEIARIVEALSWPLTAVIAATGGYVMLRLWHGKANSSDEIGRLTEAMRDLTEALQATRRGLDDVHERLDFTERLLAQGGGPSLRAPRSKVTPV
jgi:hypothetical protein